MKYFAWNAEKNEWLKQTRGIAFEEVVFHIENGDLLDVVVHSNPEKYPNQQIFVIQIEQYVYLVPFVESDTELFLKTVIPSRKATRHYLKVDFDEQNDLD
ncbi:MAG: hypothetical protein K1X65_12445 [Caldilineales bacterium]|nr:hypothetical protein [Caldilineales bacterium]MCW5857019.1 BrnT family toxin [Caldilineales bacterium]